MSLLKFDKSLLFSILSKEDYLLGSEDKCVVKSLKFSTDLLDSTLDKCLFSAPFLLNNLRASWLPFYSHAPFSYNGRY